MILIEIVIGFNIMWVCYEFDVNNEWIEVLVGYIVLGDNLEVGDLFRFVIEFDLFFDVL